MFSDAQKSDLVRRCENGEGVVAIIKSFGLDEDRALEWCKKNFRSELKAAKQVQLAQKVAG